MGLELYNGFWCITGTEMIRSEENPDGLVSKPMFDKMRRQHPDMIARRANGKLCALVYIDELPAKYKIVVYRKYADILDSKKSKTENIENDVNAVAFFQSHVLPDGKSLPLSAQDEYLHNACVLNLIQQKYMDHVAARRGKVNKRYFFDNIAEYTITLKDTYSHTLPENPRRLREKYEDYLSNGYITLVDKRYLNNNASKITDEVADYLIARYASTINRVSISSLRSEYNRLAQERGWKEIKSDRAISLFLDRPDIKPRWYGLRYGSKDEKEMYSRQHRTLLPTMRDSLWYGDGTKLNYYYIEDGEVRTCSVYEVIDVYSEVLLGFHISKTEDYDAQYHAYKMALQISSHKPYEIVYDNQGGHKKNQHFFSRLAHIARVTAPHNGKSKTIENAFKRLQEEFLSKDWFFTGQNITTKKKESRENIEFIAANKSNLKNLDEIKLIYRQRRSEWNNAPHPKTGRPRIEMYQSSINPHTPALDILDMVNLFWLENKNTVTYRASGIQITVKGVAYAYEVLTEDNQPDDQFRINNVGRKFIVRYDPDDMDMIALYEQTSSGLRFVDYARTYLYVHRAKLDQTDDEAQFIIARQQADKIERMQRREEMIDTLERHDLLPEQHGLKTPRILGISKKKQHAFSVGQMSKDISNMTSIDVDCEVDEASIASLY